MVHPKLGIAVGRRRGFPTTPKKPAKVVKKTTKPKDKKKKDEKKVKRNVFVKQLIEEVAGYSPYEGRIMELLGNVANTHSAEKRPMKFAKSRLGDIKRAKFKVKQIEDMKGRILKRQKDYEKEKGIVAEEVKKAAPKKEDKKAKKAAPKKDAKKEAPKKEETKKEAPKK